MNDAFCHIKKNGLVPPPTNIEKKNGYMKNLKNAHLCIIYI